MQATIKIPSPLRRFSDNQPQLSVQATTVGEALEQLCNHYPELRLQLLDEKGEMRNFVNIYLNREDIRSHQGLATSLSETSELRIVPAIAGGSGIELCLKRSP
ncbi:MAG: ubiquitin-like small modifier protein 1 [Motiliproteus sp.]